jgi:hypothetical protein
MNYKSSTLISNLNLKPLLNFLHPLTVVDAIFGSAITAWFWHYFCFYKHLGINTP